MTIASSSVVAVIDDDDDVRDVLEAYLTMAGHQVQTYRSGQEFLQLAEPGELDCLLVDQRMPGMTGLQLIEELDQRGVRLPAILITGTCDGALVDSVSDSSLAGILTKPMSHRDLLNFVTSLAARTLSGRDVTVTD